MVTNQFSFLEQLAQDVLGHFGDDGVVGSQSYRNQSLRDRRDGRRAHLREEREDFSREHRRRIGRKQSRDAFGENRGHGALLERQSTKITLR